MTARSRAGSEVSKLAPGMFVLSHVALYLMISALIIYRFKVALFRSEFWGEDGVFFFENALHYGWKSLFMPMFGYHFFLSRLIAYFATFFKVEWTPFIYAWSSFAVTLITLAYFARETFDWIVPKRWMRFLVCGLLSIAPGTGEVFMNLCNLHTVITWLGLLMLLERPWPLSRRRVALLLFMFCCSGEMVILIPMILTMAWLTRSRRYLALAAGGVPVILLNILGNHEAGRSHGLLTYVNVLLAPRVMIENGVDRMLFAPLIGFSLTERLMRQPGVIYWLTCTLAAALAIYWIRKARVRRETLLVMGSAIFGVIGTFAIIAICRSYSVDVIQRKSGTLLSGHRYSFLPGCMSLILWCGIAFQAFTQRARIRVTAALFLLVTLVYQVKLIHEVQPREDVQWPKHALPIQEALDRRKTGELKNSIELSNIPINPAGWTMKVVIPAS